MLLDRRNNYSNWLTNLFDDTFFDTGSMTNCSATAPALNVKETGENYIMELA